MRALMLTILLVLSGASTALAQDTRRSEVRVEEFDDEIVEGGVQSSEGTLVQSGTRRARRTLIRARTTFVAEMLKSVERL